MGDDEISVHFSRTRKRQIKSTLFFWVGEIDGGEERIRSELLVNQNRRLQSCSLQHRKERVSANAVHRRVHDGRDRTNCACRRNGCDCVGDVVSH
jgi:hypothetical protein